LSFFFFSLLFFDIRGKWAPQGELHSTGSLVSAAPYRRDNWPQSNERPEEKRGKKRKRKEKEKRKKYLSPSHRVSFFGDHVGCCPERRCEGVGRVDQTASWFRYAEVRAATSSTKPVLLFEQQKTNRLHPQNNTVTDVIVISGHYLQISPKRKKEAKKSKNSTNRGLASCSFFAHFWLSFLLLPCSHSLLLALVLALAPTFYAAWSCFCFLAYLFSECQRSEGNWWLLEITPVKSASSCSSLSEVTTRSIPTDPTKTTL